MACSVSCVGGETLGSSSQALSESPHLLLQLLCLEHQGLRLPGPLLPFLQGLGQLQLLLQQLLRLGQLSREPGALGEGCEEGASARRGAEAVGWEILPRV